jgi:hypothetical protein
MRYPRNPLPHPLGIRRIAQLEPRRRGSHLGRRHGSQSREPPFEPAFAIGRRSTCAAASMRTGCPPTSNWQWFGEAMLQRPAHASAGQRHGEIASPRWTDGHGRHSRTVARPASDSDRCAEGALFHDRCDRPQHRRPFAASGRQIRRTGPHLRPAPRPVAQARSAEILRLALAHRLRQSHRHHHAPPWNRFCTNVWIWISSIGRPAMRMTRECTAISVIPTAAVADSSSDSGGCYRARGWRGRPRAKTKTHTHRR